MEEISFSSASFSFDGFVLPADVLSVSYHEKPRAAGPVRFTGILTGTMELSPEFLRALDEYNPPAIYREQDGAVWVSTQHPVEVCPAGWAQPLKGIIWSDIGTARGHGCTNRLRKFVRRGSRLVEGRTRGRTGARSLREAIEGAGIAGLVPRRMTVEG